MRYLWILLAFPLLAQQPAGLEKQRAAARRQAESVGAWLIPGSGAPAPQPYVADCDPLPAAQAAPLIDSAAKTNDLKPELIRAVIATESALRPCAVSLKGALGLMQLMPATAEQLGVTDPFDPQQNIDAGAKLLKQLVDKYKGELSLALAAYNAGPGAVDAAAGVPAFPETQNYVKTILAKLAPSK